MATITFNNGAADGGKWSTAGNWDLGRAPLGGSTGDDAKIPKNLTCQIDTLGCVAKSVELQVGTAGPDVGGKLTCNPSANWSLESYNPITTNETSTTSTQFSTTFELDMSAAGSVGYTGTLKLNGAGTTTGAPLLIQGKLSLKGAVKKRWTLTSAAMTRNVTKSVHVDDATGWKAGDRIVFCTTQAYDNASRGSQSISNVTWAGGYLTITTPMPHNIVAGEGVWLTSLQTSLNSVPFQVYDAPTTTTLRIAMADPTVSDTVGSIVLAPRTDIVTLSADPVFDSGTTGPATISWTDGTGTGGAVVEDHADNCLCGNLTSNLIIKPVTDFQNATVSIAAKNRNTAAEISDVLFYRCRASGTFSSLGVFSPNSGHSGISFNRSVFYEWIGTAICPSQATGDFPCNDIQFYSPYAGSNVFTATSPNGSFGDLTDFCVYRCHPSNGAISPLAAGMRVIRPKISGAVNGGGVYVPQTDGVSPIEGGGIWGCYGAGFTNTALCAPITFDQVWLGKGFSGAEYSSAANLRVLTGTSGAPNINFISCPENTSGGVVFDGLVGAKDSQTAFYNRNNDPAVQDVFMTMFSVTTPVFTRETDAANIKNSTSSLKVATLGGTTNVFTRKASLLVKGGEAAIILLYVKKNATYCDGSYTLPSATLSGLGIDPITASGTDLDDTWELLDLSYAAGDAPTLDGMLTLTLSASSDTATGVVYFSGIPISPFITRCRHYGYLFDEASQTRTVDVYASASEATALAYTGATLNNTTKQITFAAGTADTMQKFYDYSRAWCVADVSRDVPFLRAGTLFDLDPDWMVVDPYYTDTLAWGTGTVKLTSTGSKTLAFSGATVQLAATGAYDLSGCTMSGTIDFTTDTGARTVSVVVPAGTSYTVEGANITVTEPTLERGLNFTGLLAGSFVRVVKNSDQSELFAETNSATTETWDDATSGSLVVDYVIMKAGYDQIHVTGVTVTGAIGSGILDVSVNQVQARWYQASSGLTLNTNAFANATTKLFGLTVASTLQNFASYLMEQWIALGGTGGAFANKPFPLAANGPNSFSWLDGWAADPAYASTVDNFRRDGMRYLNASGNVTAVWCSILTSGVPAGKQVRFKQSDAGATTDANNTGEMDQLVQIISDPNGNGDYTDGYNYSGYLALKVQAEGCDQAEADVVTLYGTLEDQLYVVGLTPAANGIATGDPALTITITDHGATPVTWNGKDFSITITDNAIPSSGTDILRELRYNFGVGGTYQGKDAFNWHDLVQKNGETAFKTVRGAIYGDTGAALKGVRVVKSDGTTPHPDFTLFTADDGTTYAPPVAAPIVWAGALDGTTVLLYNDVGGGAGVIIDTQIISGAGGYSLDVTLPSVDVAVGDPLRIRFGHKEYYAGELQGTMTETGLTFIGDMTLHPVYAAWGFDGAVYDQGYTPPGPYVMDGTNLQVDIAAGATTGLKTQLGAWTQYLMTLPAGLAAFYGAWDLLAVNQIRQNVDVVDVKIDVPTAGALFEYTDNNVNYYRSDFTFPGNVEAGHGLIAMTYNASIFVPPPTIISGESVVTGTPDTVADAVRLELAPELADIAKARKFAQNKKVLDPATGVQKVYDDDGTTVLGQGNAYMDADGTELYDGGGPVHRTERLT